MAEIDVVPRRRTHMWLWIVIAIVIVVIAMALLGMFSGDGASRVGALTTPIMETSLAEWVGV